MKIISLYFAGIIGAALLGARGCNMAFNNRTINKPAYHTESRATGLAGHVEYTRYSDGSQDVKIYPNLGHRLFGSELHQDLDGDGLVDRIRQDGPEWKMNRLNGILVRKHDYQANKERFDESDRQLQELTTEYPAKKLAKATSAILSQ
jgi:hypothetical protein